MDFLKENARVIVITLIVAIAIIGLVSLTSDGEDTESNNQETTSSERESRENENSEEDNSENSESEQSSETDENETEEQPTVNRTEESIDSTTVSGDNQTVVVRRLVDNYLNNSETELSAEQMLYVETNLVNDIGRSDYVAVGESITLNNETIEQRVQEATELSDAAIERWSAYL